jgi:hypothetical protein
VLIPWGPFIGRLFHLGDGHVPFQRGHSYFMLEDIYCLCYNQPLVIVHYYFMSHVAIVELLFSRGLVHPCPRGRFILVFLALYHFCSFRPRFSADSDELPTEGDTNE